MKKTVITILAATVILLSFLGVAFQYAQAVDPSAWYKTINGVLTSDYYDLYPYNTKSLDFGLSKFGEMINGTAGAATHVGMQYPGYESVSTYDQRALTSRDPFANEYISQKLWLNGWLLEVRYTHRTARDRRVLAMAMYADMTAYGGDWLVGHALPLESAPYGGRKTTGYATTDPLLVLYNGPREYVALSVSHIYDWKDGDSDGVVDYPDETWPIVDVRLTFIFNKVKKQVIILKDIKLIISGKELDSPVDVQFSNREEWDLGPAPDFDSYAHFWHQMNTTCYGPEWHMAPGILREYIYKGFGAISGVPVWDSRDPYGPPIANGSVRVYVNGVFKEPGIDYSIDLNTGEITWYIYVAPSAEVNVIYKLHKHEEYRLGDKLAQSEPMSGVPHLYDVAQIISSDLDYVGWKAFWPTLSDYTVGGWSMSFMPLINVSQPDIVPLEPEIPFVIGEWDFMLGKHYPLQFRGVEVVGLTDWHDADDATIGEGHENLMDREAVYQLNEVFNPWDLEDAVHKETKRWVEWKLSGVTSFTTKWAPVVVVNDDEWDSYCVFSERVLNEATGLLLNRWEGDYDITLNADGTATLTGLPSAKCKILYSTDTYFERTEDIGPFTFFDDFYGVDQIGEEAELSDIYGDQETWTDTLGAEHTVGPDNIDITATLNTTSSFNATFSDIRYGWEQDFKVFKGHTYTGSWDYEESYYFENANVSVLVDMLDIHWEIEAPDYEDVHIWNLGFGAKVDITIKYNGTSDNMNITAVVTLTSPSGYVSFSELYSESNLGRYEWDIVGRQAHSVDSIGDALVAAAFKNKQIEKGNAGMDMQYLEFNVQSVPNVMAKFGTAGNDWAHYVDSGTNPGKRAALMDDWCTNWPVASSNLITVGGPLVNLLTYYFNDFTPGFYGIPEFTPYGPWQGAVVGLTCWNKNGYYSTNDTGYATISTYKDINGSVGFIVWGVWGRDTFYACQWLHGDAARGIAPGIHQLQDAPKCLTSIILEIDYGSGAPKHPEFSIVECLGTITEREWTHGLEVKGGIHDP